MSQRKLRLDDLQVETFEVSEESRMRGTVHGHSPTDDCTPLCSEGVTCDWDCTFSTPDQRVCVGSVSCPGECGGGGNTVFAC